MTNKEQTQRVIDALLDWSNTEDAGFIKFYTNYKDEVRVCLFCDIRQKYGGREHHEECLVLKLRKIGENK